MATPEPGAKPPTAMKAPSEVQAKSVGEVVLAWNQELETRTNYFASKAKGLAEWDSHILRNRHQLMALQADLAKASTSQDRLERQLDILQVHQKQISDALTVMEAEAEHLIASPGGGRGAGARDDASASQETLYALAESVSAHLRGLGDALHGIAPAAAGADLDGDGGGDEGFGASKTTEALRAHLRTLHSLEQKIGHASAALR